MEIIFEKKQTNNVRQTRQCDLCLRAASTVAVVRAVRVPIGAT